MATKTNTISKERIGRLGQRRQVVIPREIVESLRMRTGDFLAITQKDNAIVVKPKRLVDPDDTLTTEEWELVKKAEREMRQGKYVTLAELKHDLARKRSPRRRETA